MSYCCHILHFLFLCVNCLPEAGDIVMLVVEKHVLTFLHFFFPKMFQALGGSSWMLSVDWHCSEAMHLLKVFGIHYLHILLGVLLCTEVTIHYLKQNEMSQLKIYFQVCSNILKCHLICRSIFYVVFTSNLMTKTDNLS